MMQTGVLMSRHTWMGVGGPADYFYAAPNLAELQGFLRENKLPAFTLGGGSNLIVRDGGVEGVVIKLSGAEFRQIRVLPDMIVCGGGTPNPLLKPVLLANETGGLEFLCGIPGTLGGAVRSNAGSFGGSVSDFLLWVKAVDGRGRLKEIPATELGLQYRKSDFPGDWIIIELALRRDYRPRGQVAETLATQKQKRYSSQPCNARSAGCVFKNPPGADPAGKLIEDAGCKGMRVGGAVVSSLHANYIINDGKAMAMDVEKLTRLVEARVHEAFGIRLLREAIFMGRE
ncbi:MAG: UDP-N-acetylmuramate dehydrogenase [Alphaproteobacteria bacterium]|nr:UDP-N-acetylmuramate dehydrogenase [Alphaproteobacteria bacterium]